MALASTMSLLDAHKKLQSSEGATLNRIPPSLIIVCSFKARKTLKNKRHTPLPFRNPIKPLISALIRDDSNISASLEFYSKSMALNEWFTLFEELGKMDRWLLTLEVFRWMQQQKWYKPDDGFYAKLISILGKKGQLRLAIWLFREMKKHGCRPDSSVYNALINAHLRNNKNKETALIKAFDYLEEMKKKILCKPNLVTYNTILRACAQAKQTKKMEELFKEMDDAGIKPDAYTFNGILDAYGKAGEFLDMELVLRQMRHHRVKPDFITFNTLIDAYGKAGIIVKMEEALKSMAEQKIAPQLSTFNSLINNYGSAKRVNEMELVFRNMSEMGISPRLVTYEVLLKGYGKSQCMSKMKSCLDQMRQAGIKPEISTLNMLMEIYCSNGMIKEAEDLLDKANDLDVEPTSLSYLILYKSYLKGKYFDKAESLMERMAASGMKLNEKWFLQSLETYALDENTMESQENKELAVIT